MNTNDQLKVALIQTDLFWQDIPNNLNALDKKLLQAPDADLIVLPEMFSTGFTMASRQCAEDMHGRALTWMHSRAQEMGSALCGSLVIQEDGEFYNRFILVEKNGHCSHYDKKHLFRMSDEQTAYSAGNKRVLINLKGFTICPQICYDLRFPVWSRNNQHYDLLIYVANWPEPRRAHWLSLIKARAIENQVYTLGVNRVGQDGNHIKYAGDSLVVDFNGEELINLGDTENVSMVTLSKSKQIEYREAFPAWKDADAFSIDI